MSDTDRVWKIAKKLDYCMLVTHIGKKLKSRPMSTIVRDDQKMIYVLTSVTGRGDDEIATNSDVLLNYANGSNTFLSISGSAKVVDDRDLITELWSPGAQAFWPKGPGDPEVVVIAVTPKQAELWDGDTRVVSTIKFALALATRSVPKMEKSKKVRL